MHYTGSIDKTSKTGIPGKQFDSSRDRKPAMRDTFKCWPAGRLLYGRSRVKSRATCILLTWHRLSRTPGGSVFDTEIGIGHVIPGWDQGLIGLCKGAKAELVIPPEMGYGSTGAGETIPGGATLHFDVEVMSVAKAKPRPNLFKELDVDQDGYLTKEEMLVHFKQRDPEATDVPEGLMEHEDKDNDGKISWAEFSGPKGDAPPPAKDEL